MDWASAVGSMPILFGVDLREGRVVLDDGVAAGLGDGGVVDLGVAVAAVADEVDDDVGVEGVAVVGGEVGDADDGVDVFGVDVEDGDGEALGHVGGEAGGVRLFGEGGEAEEIVDDDVDGAADVPAGEGGEDEGLGEDALAGEGGVAVHDEGEDLVAAGFAEAGLLGAGAADGDRVDGFEVAWVRDEVEGDLAAFGGAVGAGGSHVVFDVASAEGGAWVDVFELGEDLFGGAADGVGHDVEAAAVAHGEDGLGDAVGGALGEDGVEEGDEGGEAFEGEALGAEVAGLDDLLEEVGAEELGEDVGFWSGLGGVCSRRS